MRKHCRKSHPEWLREVDLDKANHGCRWAAYCTREAITEGHDPRTTPIGSKRAREIMAQGGNDLNGLSTKKIRWALEAKWGVARDHLRAHRKAIDSLVLARAAALERETAAREGVAAAWGRREGGGQDERKREAQEAWTACGPFFAS